MADEGKLSDWQSVSFPKVIVDRAKELYKENGYSSYTELLRDGGRRLIEELEMKKELRI